MFVFNKSYLDRLDDKYREIFGDGGEVCLDEAQINDLRKVKVPIKNSDYRCILQWFFIKDAKLHWRRILSELSQYTWYCFSDW